ncbi:MAG: DNA polymerase III subunit gamma/tau [Leptolyngbyaceae cyanobacterium bins.59]|nr:DNA polymerase III subunit gamma/tau [Leptolyngbyaceae cyanobacterium bins.59]
MAPSTPYIPLHHKYRPQTFAELVGQEAIATTLANALLQQKIMPAYLFTGARGTGKTSSARILAKSLNCLQSDVPTAQPCGVCDSCRMITRGAALDVIEIDAASNTGVDNIRELIEKAQFAPVQCRYKVYVIDECHMLSSAAFNALLKTLEEPPDRVVFVLATTDPQRVLPTIISRCQRFDFRRINLDAMVKHLGMIAVQEKIAITPEAVQLVAQISQGGLRDAESLLDQLSLLIGEVTVERVWDLVGAVPERELLALAESIAQGDPVGVIDRARHLMDRGREPLIVLQNLASFYRDLLIAKTAPDRNDLTAITPPTWAQVCQFVQSLDIPTLLLGQQHLRSVEVQVKNTTQPRLWLEVALMGLLPGALAPIVEPKILAAPTISSISVATSASTSGPTIPNASAPGPQKTPVAPPPTPHPSSSQPPTRDPQPLSQDLQQIWVKMLDRAHPIVKGLLKDHGRLLAMKGNEVRIGLSTGGMIKFAQQQIKKIEVAFKDVLGQDIKVRLEEVTVDESTPREVSPPESSSFTPPPSRPETPQRSAPPVASTSHFQPPTPQPPDPTPQPPIPSWEEDEVTRAAKSLAYLFNGQIVNLDDDLPSVSPVSDSQNGRSADLEEEEDDEDIPF